MEELLYRVRTYFAANGGYDLICRPEVTVYTIADAIHNGTESRMDLVAAIRIVLDEIEPVTECV